MKTNKLTIGLCMLLLAITPVLAVTTSYETSSVSRIVGDSPDDLINQLDTVELNLNHASYYAESSDNSNRLHSEEDILNTLFEDKIIKGTTGSINNWEYDKIQEDFSSYKSNELLIIEAEGNNNPLKSSHYSGFLGVESFVTPLDINSWKSDFARTYPVFIFDSDYGGLAIPNKPSFVNELTRYSQIVAPTFKNSEEFTKAMLCNLGDDKTMGHSFREARNKYYSSTSPSNEELIGITLMSYHLYGNPLATTTTQKYDETKLKKYCKDLLGEKEGNQFTQQNFETQSANNKITESMQIDYSITSKGEFELINLSEGKNQYINYEPVTPIIVKHFDLPLNAIITNISYTFSDPVNLQINIPEFMDNNLTNNSCYYGEKNQSFEFSITYKEDKQTINTFIEPLKTANCSNNEYLLYKNINLEIDYFSLSPIYFKEIEHPLVILPEQKFNITAYIGYVKQENLEGEIELFKNNKLIIQKELNSSHDLINIPLLSSDKEEISQKEKTNT
jgi:hypothetical protein